MSSSPSAFTRRTSSLAGGLGAEGELDIRSEEHTSEPQSHHDLVCRLLLEKKKKKNKNNKRQTKKKAHKNKRNNTLIKTKKRHQNTQDYAVAQIQEQYTGDVDDD